MPSDVPRCVGRLLPKSEWGDGRPGESNTTATDSEPESEAGGESNSAEESTETKTTLVTVNHGFVVDSIIVNSSNIFVSKTPKYNIINHDKPGLTKILTGTTDKNKTVQPPVLGQRISLITCALIN